MRALLIDPFTQTTTEVDMGNGKLDDLKKAISLENGLIDIVFLGHGYDLIVDDEGLFKKDQKFFLLSGSTTILAGKCLLTCTDKDGDTTGVPEGLTPEHFATHINWVGDVNSLERLIVLGRIQRPQTAINGEVVWQWSPEAATR